MNWSYEGWPAGMFWLWVLLGALLIGAAVWLIARGVGRRSVAGSLDSTLDRSRASDEREATQFEEFTNPSSGRVNAP